MLERVVEALRVDEPIPVGGGDTRHIDLLPDALKLKARGALVSGAVKAVGGLAIVGGDKRRLIVVEAEHIVAGAALASSSMSLSSTVSVALLARRISLMSERVRAE